MKRNYKQEAAENLDMARKLNDELVKIKVKKLKLIKIEFAKNNYFLNNNFLGSTLKDTVASKEETERILTNANNTLIGMSQQISELKKEISLSDVKIAQLEKGSTDAVWLQREAENLKKNMENVLATSKSFKELHKQSQLLLDKQRIEVDRMKRKITELEDALKAENTPGTQNTRFIKNHW